MSSVYSAERVDTGAPVVVKVLLPEFAAHPVHRQRFAAEGEMLSRVRHPHVVVLLDEGFTDTGEPCLVLERLRGETLRERLRRGPLDLVEAVTVIEQLAGALSAAHDASIVHRDLKPGNVFLTWTPDGRPHAKLIDFGVSKDLKTAPGDDEGRILIGSPGYMAPEQADGTNDLVDAGTDQWALALLAYEMLTGEQPFAGQDLPHTLRRVKSHEPLPASFLVPGLDAEMDGVITRGMSKDRARRYANVLEFARALTTASRRCIADEGPPVCSWIAGVLRRCTSLREAPTLREGEVLAPTLPSARPGPPTSAPAYSFAGAHRLRVAMASRARAR